MTRALSMPYNDLGIKPRQVNFDGASFSIEGEKGACMIAS